jgi:hypothetical protein
MKDSGLVSTLGAKLVVVYAGAVPAPDLSAFQLADFEFDGRVSSEWMRTAFAATERLANMKTLLSPVMQTAFKNGLTMWLTCVPLMCYFVFQIE